MPPARMTITGLAFGSAAATPERTTKTRSSEMRNNGRDSRTAETTTIPSAAGSSVALM